MQKSPSCPALMIDFNNLLIVHVPVSPRTFSAPVPDAGTFDASASDAMHFQCWVPSNGYWVKATEVVSCGYRLNHIRLDGMDQLQMMIAGWDMDNQWWRLLDVCERAVAPSKVNRSDSWWSPWDDSWLFNSLSWLLVLPLRWLLVFPWVDSWFFLWVDSWFFPLADSWLFSWADSWWSSV